MAITVRLKDFPAKASPVGTDILYCGDSADGFNEVQITVDDLMSILPSGVSAEQVQQDAFNIVADTGIADSYVLILSPAVTSLTDGLRVAFTPTYVNASTSPTIQINALTPVVITSSNASIVIPVAAISPSQLCVCEYSAAADAFLCLTPAVSPPIDFGGGILDKYIPTTPFTPTVTFAVPGDLNVSYNVQKGYYTRIGSLVFINITLQFTPTYTTASGNIVVNGLPFAANSSTENINTGSLDMEDITFPTGVTCLFSNLQPGASSINLYGVKSGSNSPPFGVTQFPTTVQGTFSLSMTYMV